jgi:hypothetical protein
MQKYVLALIKKKLQPPYQFNFLLMIERGTQKSECFDSSEKSSLSRKKFIKTRYR